MSKEVVNKTKQARVSISKRERWDIDKIVSAILIRKKLGLGLNDSIVKQEDCPLWNAAKRRFGTWRKALESIGIDYASVSPKKPYRSWSKKLVKKELLQRLNEGKDMGPVSLRREDSGLHDKVIEYYGNISNALTDIGVDYTKVLKVFPNAHWSQKRILQEVVDLHEQGYDISHLNMQKNFSKLYSAALNYFGSWENCIEECGICYSEVRKYSEWTKEKILEKLKNMFKEGERINASYMKKYFGDILATAENLFGSYRNAIEECGIDYESISENMYTLSYYGIKFERKLDILLNDLEIEYTKYTHDRWRPDYVLSFERWYDAKLSEWTIFNSSTIEKYEPCCRMLTIVYLRGDKDRDEMITPKTRILSVHKLIKQLPKHRQRYYLDWIDEIEIELNEIGNRSAAETTAI